MNPEEPHETPQERYATHLPRPTFWPAGLALAITFLLWGLIASRVVLVVGVGLFASSLAGWIKDIRNERGRLH
ncbi:MAG TPA: hypothetical protein VHC86_03360 [Opitutaceae bacterium]|nr:hypothetical protein [Opitutaceae bacterium]